MRKELVLYLPTTEDGIESSVRLLKQNMNCAILEHEGHKFAIGIEDLKKALYELEFFRDREYPKEDNSDNSNEECPVIEQAQQFEVEYGEN